jgi:DNA-directed RNA polymerase specialized sigma subunit
MPDLSLRMTHLHDWFQRLHAGDAAKGGILTAAEREVVSLRFYHSWDEAEIAELFGVTQRTVCRRWAARCARMAVVLGGELPTP